MVSAAAAATNLTPTTSYGSCGYSSASSILDSALNSHSSSSNYGVIDFEVQTSGDSGSTAVERLGIATPAYTTDHMCDTTGVDVESGIQAQQHVHSVHDDRSCNNSSYSIDGIHTCEQSDATGTSNSSSNSSEIQQHVDGLSVTPAREACYICANDKANAVLLG